MIKGRKGWNQENGGCKNRAQFSKIKKNQKGKTSLSKNGLPKGTVT
jgi:hypothetical protein